MKLLSPINTWHTLDFLHAFFSFIALALNFLGFFGFAVVIVVLVVEEEEMLHSIIEMLHSIIEMLHSMIGANTGENNRILIRGTVVLMKKNVLHFTDLWSSIIDRVYELVRKRVSLQLVSAVHADPSECFSFFFFLFLYFFFWWGRSL